jgi:putative ABC transport system substrate-binding protein
MIIKIVTVVAVLLFAAPFAVEAQPAGRVYSIGVVFPSTQTAAARNNEAFTQALRERGHVEGQNVMLERRYGEGRAERIGEIAAELVRTKVDVIVAATDQAVAVVKRQTRSIPIVMVGASDPVGTGFVASLARPGGNITGTSRMSPELSAKRLELLREAVPLLSRVAVMWNPDVRGALLDFKELEGPARSLRLQLQSVEVTHADGLASAFSAIVDTRAQAVVMITPNPAIFTNLGQIASFAEKHRLPFMSGAQAYADAGGLMAYGPSTVELWRQSAAFVDKILKGAKPGDLPVEQPIKLDLVINRKAARAIGLTIPPSLLRRADRVVQ